MKSESPTGIGGRKSTTGQLIHRRRFEGERAPSKKANPELQSQGRLLYLGGVVLRSKAVKAGQLEHGSEGLRRMGGEARRRAARVICKRINSQVFGYRTANRPADVLLADMERLTIYLRRLLVLLLQAPGLHRQLRPANPRCRRIKL